MEVIEQLPELKNLVDSFYLCKYAQFFKSLGKVLVFFLYSYNQCVAIVEGLLKEDWIVKDHTGYIVKELRIRAYAQMLQSYRSLSLASMASYFGVSQDFIDRYKTMHLYRSYICSSEVSRFIAAGRLNCVIDKVAGVVVMNPPDRRNTEYQTMIKQGDALLNKVHKLSRVISQ